MGRYLLSLRELAAVLGKDVSTVHRMEREGRIPVEVIDSLGVKVVRRSDLEKFLGLEPGSRWTDEEDGRGEYQRKRHHDGRPMTQP